MRITAFLSTVFKVDSESVLHSNAEALSREKWCFPSLKWTLLCVAKGFFNISKALEREEYTELWIKKIQAGRAAFDGASKNCTAWVVQITKCK